MNTSWTKNLLRMIRSTKSRFFSLTAIVTIGVAFFVGLSGTSPVMGNSVDVYDDQQNLKDLTIYSNYGFDQDDIDAIQDCKDVKKAEGAYFADVMAACKEKTYVTRIHSYNEEDTINRVVLKSGRMPKNKNEALAEAGSDLEQGFELGSTVTFSNDTMTIKKVKIVGTIDTPMYLNESKESSTLGNQNIRTYLYVPESSFDTSYYTEVNVLTKKGQSYYSFSDEYESYIKKVKKEIKQASKKLQNNRYQKIKDDAQEEIDQAQQEIEDGTSQIESAKAQLESSQAQLDSEYASNKQTIESGLAEVQTNQATLNQSQSELNEKKAEVEKAQENLTEIDSGLSTLDSSIAQLQESANGLSQLESGIAQYDAAIEQYQALLDGLSSVPDETPVSEVSSLQGMDGIDQEGTVGQAKTVISSQIQAVTAQKASLEAQKEQINSALSAQGIDDVNSKISELQEQRNTLQSQRDEIVSAQSQIDSAQATIDASQAQLNSAYAQLQSASATLESTVASSQQQINEGWAEIEENQEKINVAKKEVEKAKNQLDEMENGKWTILDRESHYASATYKATVEQMAAVGKIFPVFFILVAALVCMTTMKRMVDEERGEIGTLRALGYTQLQCTSKYVNYAILATVLGIVIGTIVGMMTFPTIIYNTYRMMYILPDIQYIIPWNYIIAASVSFLAGMILTTWLSCRNDMKEVPSQLMRPKSPKLGKNTYIERIGWLWKRFSFTWKVTIRNIFRYKRRFAMTVIGVAGCSALLVTGFGVKDSINDIVNIQYKQVYKYDGYATLEDITQTQANQLLKKIQKRSDVKYANMIYSYNGTVNGTNEEDTATVQIYEHPSEVKKVFDLRTRKGHKPISIAKDGVVISEKLSENLDVSIGDSIELENENGTKKSVKITGITEMYVNHYIFMSQAYYEKIFGAKPDTRAILIQVNGGTKVSQALQKDLVDMDGVDGITFYDVSLENFNDMIDGLDVVIWAIIISSMLLAFVVLSNLINVNISERKREIATLKVLGFRKTEVQSYIYKENNVLVFLGALCGLPIGVILHHYIMRLVEMDYVMFGRSVSWHSFVYAVALTLLFGFIVDRFMARKLHAIEMVDSLKSVE